MNKKIICIGVVSLFLLIGVSVFSASALSIETKTSNQTNNNEIYTNVNSQTKLYGKVINSITSEGIANIYVDLKITNPLPVDNFGDTTDENGNYEIVIPDSLFDNIDGESHEYVMVNDNDYEFYHEEIEIIKNEEVKYDITLEPVNSPPDIPEINLESSKIVLSTHILKFSVITTDPDGDNVKYGWDWDGDFVVDEWTGPFQSGEIVEKKHTWDERGHYRVYVKAKDIHGLESNDWGCITFNLAKSKPAVNSLLVKLLDLFPNAFPLLQHLLKL